MKYKTVLRVFRAGNKPKIGHFEPKNKAENTKRGTFSGNVQGGGVWLRRVSKSTHTKTQRKTELNYILS
jgi:hypothetical protein